MDKVKVLHVNTLDAFGGAAQVANDLIAATKTQTKFAVGYKTTTRPEVVPFSKRGFYDWVFRAIDKIRSILKLRSPIRIKLGLGDTMNGTYSKLKKMKAYQEADIIHLHNIHGGFFDLSALIPIAREKKIVWTLHDMWIMTGGEAYTFDNDNYKSGIAETPFSNYYPLSDPYFDRRTHYMAEKKKVYQQIAKSLKVVPVSYWLERSLRQSFVYDNNIEVRTIINGIDLQTFRNTRQRNWTRPRILFFNLESPFKGSHLFIDIIKSIPQEFDLLLVGGAIEGVKPLKYFDFIKSRAELAELYNEADILVFPSLAESLGLTVMEAMACGVCVIASDTGGIPEILRNDCGMLFRSTKSADLLEKIKVALSDLEAVRAMGLRAESFAHPRFDLANCARAYEALYAELLHRDAVTAH